MPRALWYDGHQGAELAEAAEGEGELTLTALFSGVSRGTEGLVWRGRVPASEHERMRCPHQEGAFPGPVKYGYAMVARDDAGRAGFVLHPHQERFRVPTAAFHPLPPDLPPQRAVLTPNLETALNAVWDAGVAPGDRVVVIGAGVVGCLVGWICAGIPGTEVTLVDMLPERAFVAETLGCAFADPSRVASAADRVFHTTATAAGLQTALGAAGLECTVTELSWYGTGDVQVALGGAFHSRRLGIQTSQVARLPVSHERRWTFARRLQTVLGLLADPVLDTLIDSECRFDDLPNVLAAVFDQPTLCHRVRYR